MKNLNPYNDFVCLTSIKHYNDQPTSTKDGRINLRFKADDMNLIRKAIYLAGFASLAQFVREAATDAANRVIDEHNNVIAVTGDYMGENC